MRSRFLLPPWGDRSAGVSLRSTGKPPSRWYLLPFLKNGHHARATPRWVGGWWCTTTTTGTNDASTIAKLGPVAGPAAFVSEFLAFLANITEWCAQLLLLAHAYTCVPWLR